MKFVPKVSVIIPTYNYDQYICDSINSVLQQTYLMENIEIIVVDDGSTDNTSVVLAPFIKNGTIQYYFQMNGGKASATRFAIQKCTGKYIFNLDADDLFLPSKIEESIKVFESDDDLVHVATPAKYFYEVSGNEEIESLPSDMFEKIMDGNWLLERLYTNNLLLGGGSTFAARSSILTKIEIPDSVDMFIDEFLILAVLPFGKSFFIGHPLSVWRVHNRNYSGNTSVLEGKLSKGLRFLKSSAAVLSFLQENRYPASVVKIYRLQDATRKIVYKEGLNTKNAIDIFSYLHEVLFQIRPGIKLIQKYYVINRLFPTCILSRLRALKYYFFTCVRSLNTVYRQI